MNLKDMLKVWDVAAQHAMEDRADSKTPSARPAKTGWLRLRTGILAGFGGGNEPPPQDPPCQYVDGVCA